MLFSYVAISLLIASYCRSNFLRSEKKAFSCPFSEISCKLDLNASIRCVAWSMFNWSNFSSIALLYALYNLSLSLKGTWPMAFHSAIKLFKFPYASLPASSICNDLIFSRISFFFLRFNKNKLFSNTLVKLLFIL